MAHAGASSSPDAPGVELIRAYFAAVERGANGDALRTFLHPDFVHRELPNRMAPNGQERDLAASLAASIRGRGLLSSQQFDLGTTIAEGDRVAVEGIWTGTLAIDIGPFTAGTTLRAHFGAFFELRDGLILTQHNYDCYEP